MSRRGKQVSEIELGFVIFQAFAGMMLLGILFSCLGAVLSFHGSEDYLPVEITYSATRSYTTSEGQIQYKNTYSYVVDGKVYEKEETSHVEREPGTTIQRYYCPSNPDYLSEYSTRKEWLLDLLASSVYVIVLFVFFEAIAIFYLVKVKKKKREIDAANTAYEEKIRRDMQKNRDLYKNLGVHIDEQKMFLTLEPLRKRIRKNQKALDRLDRHIMAMGNGLIFILIYSLVVAVERLRENSIKNQLNTDLRNFYIDYKRNIGEPVLKLLLEDVQYKPGQGFSKEEIMDFKVYGNRRANYQSEDYIEGIYKGVHYRQSDVKIERPRNESELSAMTQGLTGRISVYDFKKGLTGDILIRSRLNSDGVIGNLTKVNMENVAFNEKFEVYAKSAHMVFYLLTPQFMEYLLGLDFMGSLVLRFTGNQVIVLRNHISGIFEPDLKRPLDIPYEIGKSYQELKDILDFIDLLNLDRVAEEANARAEYGESMPFEESQDTQEEKTVYGVVDQEDSVFGGPDLEKPEDVPPEEPLFANPVNKPSDSGLRLRL
ncbi:MAG: DUF3137 domain-containing protein [Clostridium sp.]|nr:DUF3137 domain-containing protein [Clostridium sp.]